MANLRINDFLPSKFSGKQGQDPKAHFLSFEDYLTVHDINEIAPIVARFKHTLEGTARLWVEGKQFANLNQLKAAFTQYFSGIHSREASARLFRNIAYSAGESVESYATKIRGAAEQLGYNEDMIRDQFLQGLPHNLQLQLSMSAAQNMQQLIGFAQKYIDLSKASVGFVDHVNVATASSNSDIDKLADQVASLARVTADGFSQMTRRDRSKSRSPSRERNRGRQDRRKNGSQSQRRRSGTPVARAWRTSGDFRCHYCDQRGHGWKACPTLQRDVCRGKIRKDFQ